MRQLIYFNNASFKLAAVLPAVDGFSWAVMDREPSEAHIDLPRLSDGFHTVATITDPSLPGVHEIVFLSEIKSEDDTISIAAERAQERTTAQAWPVGALVECRVTEGMLRTLGADTMYSAAHHGIAMNGGDTSVDYDEYGDSMQLHDAWAIGGLPVAPARGFGESSNRSIMATSVEGVGYSNAVELGVAPNHVPGQAYYPGDFVKDPASPFWTYGYARGKALPLEAVALGEPPWERYAPETDSNIVSFQRINQTDVWFYPTEIGFICEAYSATSAPTIIVKELDKFGDVVGDLIASKTLTGVGVRQRIVLANNLTKGIKGLNFVRTATAVAGTCRGRFYWKGLFICSNSSAGYPTEMGSSDGHPQV